MTFTRCQNKREEENMSKKLIRNCMLFVAICFLILGGIFKMTAKEHEGTQAITGVMINGEFQSISSGRLGANQEKYETLNTGGNVFLVFAGITGIVGIVMFVGDRRK